MILRVRRADVVGNTPSDIGAVTLGGLGALPETAPRIGHEF